MSKVLKPDLRSAVRILPFALLILPVLLGPRVSLAAKRTKRAPVLAPAPAMQRFECDSMGSDNVVCAVLPPERNEINSRLEKDFTATHESGDAAPKRVPSMALRSDLSGGAVARAGIGSVGLNGGSAAEIVTENLLDNSLAKAFEARDQLRSIEIFLDPVSPTFGGTDAAKAGAGVPGSGSGNQAKPAP